MNKIIINKYGVIIDEKLFKNNEGNNINGPCIIKVPDFIKNSLGKYYLYFAHHQGSYIRMAYSNNILGPYTLYEYGVLHLKNTIGYNHIASPDVIVDETNKRLVMYYHCPYNNGKTSQSTFYAYSFDGLLYNSEYINILHPYFRYFKYNEEEYGIAMYKQKGSIIYKKNNIEYEEYGELLPKSRHTSILVHNSKIFVFYSIVGDCPEHICYSEILKINKNKIKTGIKNSIVKPEYKYEHDDKKPKISKYGSSTDKVNQLRDPYVFKDDDKIYLLYTVCGEKGIAICEIENF